MGSDLAPRALVYDSDLLFSVRITESLNKVGYDTRTVRRLDAFADAITTWRPRIAIVNMSSRGVEWQAAVTAAQDAGLPMVAFGPHVETEAQNEARRLGAAAVVANSQLVADLPAIIERALRRAKRRLTVNESATQADAREGD
ncbi:MAG: hypothetical protein ACRDHE_02420 [Ktedonobacterales bacterium]